MASLHLQGLRKSFGQTPILHGVDLQVRDGAFVVLVGPSGSGKSTLLRMIAGLEDITGGELRIGDRVVNDLSPVERDIAMVFQSYALYPHMTVAGNLAFALKRQRMPAAEIAQRVQRAAAMLGLEPLLARYPAELSGGQRQRVAMGRAIVREPAVFLFDEPLSNLDAKLRVQVRAEIKALYQRLGTTTVYVTHDQGEAMTLGDTVVVLNEGRVEQIGSPLELYDRPANRFVAGFIGSPAMNLLPGHLRAGVFYSDAGPALAPDPLPAGVADGPCMLGVRPEHLHPVTDGGHGLPCTVQVVEPMGALTQLTLDLAGTPLTALWRERVALRPGDAVQVRPEAGCTHLFNPADGQRLG